jgi:thiol:disulfide interchange protein
MIIPMPNATMKNMPLLCRPRLTRYPLIALLLTGAYPGNALPTYASNDFSELERSSSSSFLNAQPEDEFLAVNDAFNVQVSKINGDHLVVDWQIAPDYYLYKRSFKVTTEKGKDVTALFKLSRGIQKYDGYFGQVEIFYHHAKAQSDLKELSGNATLTIEHQGCADAGLCYPTQREIIDLNALN